VHESVRIHTRVHVCERASRALIIRTLTHTQIHTRHWHPPPPPPPHTHTHIFTRAQNLVPPTIIYFGFYSQVAALCNRLIDRDDRTRSAAELTLVEMLRAATDATDVLHTLLAQCSSDRLAVPPAHPGQVGGGPAIVKTPADVGVRRTADGGDDGAVKRRERILHVVERWVASEVDDALRSGHGLDNDDDDVDDDDRNDVENASTSTTHADAAVGATPTHVAGDPACASAAAAGPSACARDVSARARRWADVLAPFAISIVLSKPEDAARVQLATRMAPRLALPDCLGSVLGILLRVLREQDPLSADVLDRDSAGTLTKTLLFQRLSPLLLLRMLPNAAFTAVGSEGSSRGHVSDEEQRHGRATTTVAREGTNSDGKSGAATTLIGEAGHGEESTPVGTTQEEEEDGETLVSVADTLAGLRGVFIERMTIELEFDDVRRVAAELLSRGPPTSVFPAVLAALSAELDAFELGGAAAASSPRDPSVAKCMVCVVSTHRVVF
jgi:hypothetical protein